MWVLFAGRGVLKMGMFDYVKFKDDCQKCGKPLDGFQSKDGPRLLIKLDYWEVDNFYTGCRSCNTWVEYTLKKKRPKIPLSYYKKSVEEIK